MIIHNDSVFHPNAIKHIAELLGQGKLSNKILDELIDTNFKDSKDGITSLKEFLEDKVSTSVSQELVMKVIDYIYKENNPNSILYDYASMGFVSNAIRKKVNKENNNKNYTYDLDRIINDFKIVARKHYSSGYNYDTNGLGRYLINAFNFYGASPNGSKLIYSTLNTRGTVVNTSNGDITLEQLASQTVDDTKVIIDFPSIVRDIYEASEVLFSVSKVVCYDLFSHYLSEELINKSQVVKEIISTCFGFSYLGPLVTMDLSSSVQDTEFKTKTLKQRILILDKINENVTNGLTYESTRLLFEASISIDYSTVNSSNIGNLFKHGKNTKGNYDKFFKILKGVVSMKEFIRYIKSNNFILNKEDYVLFREPEYFKRFKSLKDYFSLRDITPSLIKEGNDVVDEIPYCTNDECYTRMMYGNSDFTLLSSLVKSELSRNRTEFNINSYQDLINQFVTFIGNFYGEVEDLCSKLESMGADVTSKEAFDAIKDNIEQFDAKFELVIYPSEEDKLFRESYYNCGDITFTRRFLNLQFVVFKHLLSLLEYSRLPIDNVLIDMNKDLLFLPQSVQDVGNLSMFSGEEPIKFYLGPNDTLDDLSFKKHYYFMYNSIMNQNKDVFKYLTNWLDTIKRKADYYGISLSDNTLPYVLRASSVLIGARDFNNFLMYTSLKNNCEIVEGYFFQDGKPIKYQNKYVHSRGYFVNPLINYNIEPIPFDTNL